MRIKWLVDCQLLGVSETVSASIFRWIVCSQLTSILCLCRTKMRSFHNLPSESGNVTFSKCSVRKNRLQTICVTSVILNVILVHDWHGNFKSRRMKWANFIPVICKCIVVDEDLSERNRVLCIRKKRRKAANPSFVCGRIHSFTLNFCFPHFTPFPPY